MSVLTPKRVFLFVVAAVLSVPAFASHPSPRVYARMAFDDQAGVGVLFGGRGAFDSATQLIHSSNETWLWDGSKWIQAFPLDRPAPRSAQGMAYDSTRKHVVLFGGRREAVELKTDPILFNDTWAWEDDNWVKIETGNAPSPRYNVAMAYDAANDRIVLFGGTRLVNGFEPEALFDTWEFDGSTWTQVGTSGEPDVAKPVLAYDSARGEVIMMGVDKDDLSRVMYRYDAGAQSWTAITPETLPTCVNEGTMVDRSQNHTLLWLGGICIAGTPPLDEPFEWDGTNWTKITTQNSATRAYAQAVAYDPGHDTVVFYGGSIIGSTNPIADTSLFRNNTWRFRAFTHRPYARSLAGFNTDESSGNIWLFGGLYETSSFFLEDLWGYRGSQWYPIVVDAGPSGGCANGNAAFDTDRNFLVITCSGQTVYEFRPKFVDESKPEDPPVFYTWVSPTPPKAPEARRFASMVYDPRLKKTILFGGYGTTNYFDDTWLWDGSTWTEVKGDKPNKRGLAAMWYDPLLQRTVIYGGIGRPNLDSKVTRFSDMWSFDGTRWTKISVSTTPGERLGAQIAVQPDSGKVLLFGGLRAESDDKGKVLRQFYANDTWEWNGASSSWVELHPDRSPDARENAMMAWDPSRHEIVVFGGYALGFYHSDVWAWDGVTWRPLADETGRRRPSKSPEPPLPAPRND